MTGFPMTPCEVAVLAADEFVFDLDWKHPPSLNEICLRFEDDTNRALVWCIRFRALEAWSLTATANAWDKAGAWTSSDVCAVAAWFDLNDRWEFDHDEFCRAIDHVVLVRSTGH